MPKHLTPPTVRGGLFLTDLEGYLIRAIRAWQHNPSLANRKTVLAAFDKTAPLAKVALADASRGRVRPRGRHARTTP